MVNGLREIRLDLLITPFNLNYTLTCGQTFRWERHNNWWHGVAYETLVKIQQIDDLLQFQTFPWSQDLGWIRCHVYLLTCIVCGLMLYSLL